jgi:hypothetical protein
VISKTSFSGGNMAKGGNGGIAGAGGAGYDMTYYIGGFGGTGTPGTAGADGPGGGDGGNGGRGGDAGKATGGAIDVTGTLDAVGLNSRTDKVKTGSQGAPGAVGSAGKGGMGGGGGFNNSGGELPAGKDGDAGSPGMAGTPGAKGSANSPEVAGAYRPLPPFAIDSKKVATTATMGKSYTAAPSAKGGTAPLKWSAFGLPTGLSVAAKSGTISGTPSVSGSFPVELLVVDSGNPESLAAYGFTLAVSKKK